MEPASADLPDLPKEWRCNECGNAYEEPQLLKAPNPFNAADTLYGCPNCKAVNEFREVCQAPDCEEDATCGTPRFRDMYRYARVCGKHFREDMAFKHN